MTVADKLNAVAYTKGYIHGDFVYNPRTIQEKLAHIKIFGTTPEMTICADKLNVKQYVRNKLGVDICVPLLQAYGRPEDIDVEKLPDRFVLKCNHGCGYNIIVHDKKGFDRDCAIRKLSAWLSEDFSLRGHELQYKNIPRRCFAEQYIESPDERIKDYKFLCFNGVPKFVKVEIRSGDHGIWINCYDMDFKLTDIENVVYPKCTSEKIQAPKEFDDMRRYAETLSKDFDFVRVDFMVGKDRFYLGEMTFTPGNCRMKYVGDPETGLKLGSMLKLSR